jgi:hypothetical protein
MTEQEQLIQEIRQRLGNTPKAGMIDSLAYATRLSQDYQSQSTKSARSSSKKLMPQASPTFDPWRGPRRRVVAGAVKCHPLFKRVSAPAPRRKSTLSR